MGVIGDMYRSSNKASERSMHNDRTYKKLKNQVKQNYNILSEKLSESERDLLDRLMMSCDAKMERKNVHCFKAGFETGLAAAIEALKQP